MSVKQIYPISNWLVLKIANGFPMYLVKANVFIGMKTLRRGVCLECHLDMKKNYKEQLTLVLLAMPTNYS
jgi:hypothetical protein